MPNAPGLAERVRTSEARPYRKMAWLKSQLTDEESRDLDALLADENVSPRAIWRGLARFGIPERTYYRWAEEARNRG